MKQYAAYFFDLDGTIYREKRLVPRADETLMTLRERGAKIIFLTNNGRHSGAIVYERLVKMGIHATADEVLTAADATIEALKCDAPGACVFAISGSGFLECLSRAGFTLAQRPEQTDIVVVGFNSKMVFDDLRFAHMAVRHGARIWATNPDPCFPTDGAESPHTGAILAAVEASTGVKAKRIIGKPMSGFIGAASERAGVPLAECLMVGDRLDTDILAAQNAGAPSALVLTGIATREAASRSDIQPTYVIESIVELV